jgi:hemerythrin-like domain-containing protein
MEKLLRVLERELGIFERGDRPDYDVLLGTIDYFKDYPDSCHHPKEDLIFQKLKVRDPDKVASFGDLEAEHREGARRLSDVATVVHRVLNDEDLVRHAVSEIVRNFIERERQHMVKEERIVFPAALDVLQSADWADIALRMADRYEPLAHPTQEAKYDLLQRNILEMEEEAEAQGADRTR